MFSFTISLKAWLSTTEEGFCRHEHNDRRLMEQKTAFKNLPALSVSYGGYFTATLT